MPEIRSPTFIVPTLLSILRVLFLIVAPLRIAVAEVPLTFISVIIVPELLSSVITVLLTVFPSRLAVAVDVCTKAKTKEPPFFPRPLGICLTIFLVEDASSKITSAIVILPAAEGSVKRVPPLSSSRAKNASPSNDVAFKIKLSLSVSSSNFSPISIVLLYDIETGPVTSAEPSSNPMGKASVVSNVVLTTSSKVVWRTCVSVSKDLTIPVWVVNASPVTNVPLVSFNTKFALKVIAGSTE